jgi:hypothetical protein
VLLAVILAAIVISNLPPSATRRLALKPFAPLLRATGLSQSWYLFAPDPSLATVRLAVVIEYEDGTRLSWTPPSHGRFLGAYNDYHWRGLDAAAQANIKGSLWPELARWLAETNQKPNGPTVTGVTFYRGVAETPPPGSHRKRRWRIEKLSTFNAPFTATPST